MASVEGTEPRKRSLSVRTRKGCDERGSGNGELRAAEEYEDEPLSPAARLFHEPHFNCYIVAILGIGVRSFDVAAVRTGLEATFLRHPRFSSVQVLDGGKPRWVGTQVNLDYHIVVPDLDSDVSPTAGDQLVEDYVSSLTRGPHLDPSRPLWDLHLLKVPTSHSEAVAVMRLHHSLGDGASLMSLVLASTRKASDPAALPTIPDVRRSKPAKPRCGPFGLLLSLWAAIVLLWNTLVDVLLFVATIAFLNDTATPLMGSKGVEFRPKRLLHKTVSLHDVKAVKNAMRCTINDVLVGVTSAGLSRYLSRKYESIGETEVAKKKKKTPLSNIRLRSALIVNIRESPGIQALADMMEKGKGVKRRWGNWFAYVLLPFRIGIHEDPLEYVRQAKVTVDRKKESLEAICSFNSASLIAKLFGMKAAAALCYRVLSHTTLSFSNVIGPVEEIVFYGHPVVYLAPTVYGHPHALTIHYQSYANKMTIVLTVDELAIPDPHQLLKDLAESLKLMKDALRTT